MFEEDLQYHEFIAEMLICDALRIRMSKMTKRHYPENVKFLDALKIREFAPDSRIYRDLSCRIADVIDESLREDGREITFHQIHPIEKLKLARKIYVLFDQFGLHCDEKYLFRRLNVIDNQLHQSSQR